jgi:ABC-type phosphate transport system auxiliary subunit
MSTPSIPPQPANQRPTRKEMEKVMQNAIREINHFTSLSLSANKVTYDMGVNSKVFQNYSAEVAKYWQRAKFLEEGLRQMLTAYEEFKSVIDKWVAKIFAFNWEYGPFEI